MGRNERSMSYSDSDGPEEQQHEWNEWSDDERSGFRSLFEPDTAFGTLEEALAHDEAHHGFNLREFRAEVRCCMAY